MQARGPRAILSVGSRLAVFLLDGAQLASAGRAIPARNASASALPAYNDPPQVSHDTFYSRHIEYDLAQPSPRSNLEDVKFGTVFTDHMLVVEHAQGIGWGCPQVRPFGYLQLHPAAQVLHYGMTCFEGMKAYRGLDGRARLFRPERNMARLASSAARLQLAPFDQNELLECIKALVRVDSGWLPSKEGFSLYIRPFMFSSAHVLGVAPTTRTTLSVVMSPVGPYFPTGLRAIDLFVEESAARAWPGGVGQFKVGGNYAPTIQPQMRAAQSHGAQQVVYTHRLPPGAQKSTTGTWEAEDAEFEECGAMNIFFLLEKPDGTGTELVTPDLRGTILPGITRDSILTLCREWGEFDVSERAITLREVRAAAREGRLREIFGSGTACIVQPVGGLIRANGEAWKPQVSDPTSSQALAPRLQRALLDIQYGLTPHPWSVVIE